MRNAAFLIDDMLDSYEDRVEKMRYQQETATLNSIINQLENEFATSVTLLGLTEWVTQLKNSNTEFNDKYIARSKQISKEEEGVVAEHRLLAIADYRKLARAFDARMAVAALDANDLLENYKQVAKELNAVTEQYNDAIANAAAKRKNNDDDDETTTDANTTEEE